MRQQLPDMEFGRRMAVERELEKVDGIRLANIIFDETGHFVLYGTMLGIKVINVETNRYLYEKIKNIQYIDIIVICVSSYESVTSLEVNKKHNINNKQGTSKHKTLNCIWLTKKCK